MRSRKFALLYLAVFLLGLAPATFGQDELFSDPSVAYSFTVPDERWKMVTKPTTANPNVEYVFNDRREGHLEVRKLDLPKNSLLMDAIQEDEQKKQFLRGYVAGKEENFSGRYRGTIYNFEYVEGGKPMTGRYYYLKVSDTVVYVLRFAGLKDTLKSIRNQTDIMARTFAVK